MNLCPQNRHGWLRYLCITVHGGGIGLLSLCASLSSIVDPPMPLLHPYSQALKVVLAIQCVVTLALFAFDRRLTLWSLGIIAFMFLLLPFATAIKES